jgi:DNA-binding transcriptional LysR family regulator
VPRAVVPILLKPLIASFCQAHPDVQVEIAASENMVDIAEKDLMAASGWASSSLQTWSRCG